MKHLSGTSLAGMSPTRDRVEHDFYATPFEATRAILDREPLEGSILEPACGQGHISKALYDYYPKSIIVSTDIVQREDKFNVRVHGGIDFLSPEFDQRFDNVITNPPFSLAKEFAEKALSIANKKVILFAKIQFLESEKRKEFLMNSPLKYVYVFSNRVATLNNGSPVDEKGKPWATTMCHAWFVWEHGYAGEPTIRWI